MECHVKAEPK